MLAAHMDEIGFLVQNITANGFLQLVGIGGWWPHTLLSQRVLVKTRSGRSVQGVIGSKPPHFLPEGQRNSVMSMEALFVDVGAESAEQVKMNSAFIWVIPWCRTRHSRLWKIRSGSWARPLTTVPAFP